MKREARTVDDRWEELHEPRAPDRPSARHGGECTVCCVTQDPPDVNVTRWGGCTGTVVAAKECTVTCCEWGDPPFYTASTTKYECDHTQIDGVLGHSCPPGPPS